MKRSPESLRGDTFDLLVLGGGITGAGVALDAVLRGLRVALIDKSDFCSGASGASSKLIHGGLRYLEHGHLLLVREALVERARLLRNAPHLVSPLRFVIPYSTGSRVAPWKWRLGLAVYDMLGGAVSLPRSRPLSPDRVRDLAPDLKEQTAGCEYFDARMDDARLCLSVLRTAAGLGARVVNYTEAVAFEVRDGQIIAVRARDRLGGDEFLIRAAVVLNATGCWVDEVCGRAGDTSGPHLDPTKGVHIIAPGRATSAAALLLHPADGRVFFALPWDGKTLIGTTDTGFTGLPDRPRVDGADVDYLLDGYNAYFDPELTHSDLLGQFVGVRPLLGRRPGVPSARSREYRVFWSANGLLTVAGGKYTTYRRMAEVVTDAVMGRLGLKAFCRTASYRLDGCPDRPWAEFFAAESDRLGRVYGLPPDSADHLVRRYGTHAAAVAARVERNPALAKPILHGEPHIRAELAYQRDEEMAVFPADHLYRRTSLGYLTRQAILVSGVSEPSEPDRGDR